MKCLVCADREPYQPAACDPCRLWLPTVLRDIAEGYAELAGEDPAEVGRLLIEDDGTFDAPAVYDVHPLSAGPIRARNGSARVSGSRDAPVPVRLDLVDLTAPARPGSLLPHANAELHQHAAIVLRTKTIERHPYPARWTDQIGHLSVATELEHWVIDWIGERGLGEHRPDPSVPALAEWLTDRIPDACDSHPAIDEFAADMRRIRSTISAITAGRREYPELISVVPCSGCDTVALFRPVKSPYRAECGTCGKLYTEDEYQRWTGLLAAQAKGRVA